MAEITAKTVNELRQSTGAGLMDCKRALVEAQGNLEEAATLLKKKGMATAAKKAGRDASEGLIQSYIHLGGKVGVLLELNCETDFVAKNEEFAQLARDLCMHVAAAGPISVSREDVDPAILEKEKDIARAQAEGKPPAAIEKIVQGKLDKFLSQVCLMEQPFVKNPDLAVKDLLTEKIAKMGENIQVRRFVRYQLGE